MQKQKNGHYKIILTVLGLSILIINSCRKMEISVSSNVMTTEKFFTVSPNINPSVKKVVDKLKSINNNKEFVSTFIDNEGFAIWDKAMVTVTNHKKSGIFSTSRNSSDSTNSYDTTITIPVVLNSTLYVNAAIVAKINDSISLSLFRGQDYSKLPYGNHGVDTFTAEKYAVQFMKLEKRVFGTNSFLLTDHNLFSYLLNNNNGRTSLLPGSFDITMGSGECVDMINLLYNNPDMIISNGTITCVGFEQGGGPIDTHMPPIINTGGGGSTGGSGGSPVGGGGNNNGNGGSTTGGVRPPNGLGWVPVEEFDPYLATNVIIDTSITNNFPCLEKILDTIATYGNLNQKAQVALNQIFNVNKRIKTTVKLDRTLVGTTTSAYTKRTGTSPSDASDTAKLNFEATIFINPDLLINGTKEYIATTLVHEAMHAYIDYVFTLYQQGYIPLSDSNYVKSRFPIFWGGALYPFSSPTQIQQHNLIALNWVQQVSDPLYGFTNNDINPTLKDSIYKALGWGGLEATDIFKLKTDKCATMALNIAARNKNQGIPFTIVGYPECTSQYSVTAQSLKLKNLCD